MIYEPSSRHAISSLGWVDHGALWVYDVVDRTETRIPIPGAQYLSLVTGRDGYFSVGHRGGRCAAITIRHLSDPAAERASVHIEGNAATFLGDNGLWKLVEPVYAIPSPPRLIKIDRGRGNVTDLDLTWYTSGYDLGYQALVGAMSLPDSNRVLVSVQRSSVLTEIDIDQNCRVGSIDLADRHGNPDLVLRTQQDFLASDYDTLCRVDIQSRSVVAKSLLQEASNSPPHYQRQFIGNYYLTANGSCVVARPFGGDVLLLNSLDLTVMAAVPVGMQPLDVCMTCDGDVIARDWMSGTLLLGQFES